MSEIFGNSKSVPGCFVKERMTGNVEGAMFHMGGDSKYSIVAQLNFRRSDDYTAVKCLGDKAYINVFGKSAIAEMDVTLTLFLIDGKESSGVLSAYKESFDSQRLANGGGECSLTVGSKSLVTGYAVDITLGGNATNLGLGEATVHVISLEDR